MDYVIAGGGSAGCVMAARLSEDPSVSVTLVEAGRVTRDPRLRLPAGLPESMHARLADWDFATVPQPGLDGRRIRTPRGRALGGSSAINAMCYARGSLKDYDDWGHGWSGAEALRWFKASEGFRGPDADGGGQWHGHHGPLTVERPATIHRATERFFDGAAHTGHARVEEFCAEGPDGSGRDGVGLFDRTTDRGLRGSVDRAYLPAEVRARPNLTVRTGAQVAHVLMDGTRACGLRLLDGTEVRARETVLCAGAIGTPHLLMLSGIGPADHLRAAGVTVALDAPGVGGNLQDHLDVSLMLRTVGSAAFGYGPAMLPQALRGAWDWLRHRRGLLASNLAEGQGYARSRAGLDRPDIQFHFLPGLGEDHGATRNWGRAGVSLHACCLYPRSTGTIRLASADPADAPLIDPRYLSDEADLAVLVAGGRMAAAILSAPSFDPVRVGWHRAAPPDPEDRAGWEALVRARAETIYHPVGTARMGAPGEGVCDGMGVLHGARGLRVVDASLMPRIVGGNTNAPVVMMAERIAAGMRSDA
ncbi:GMC family oxidoreductase N-terminal domain-containing protein [Jannaschia sp. Os4]|uniref:GMC family oxidoreductase n=1 Tax=Jannaschia sp. Os4 TaxID=2807617 RepID=UPI001939CAD5|nr:GMC family oxidoreductase N-terminal domain-containing protein [Jannaschia sp. Os4]MBM2575785.1 GMC family oxidoreductase N-terminal domain-containing protein [Jannaschia sp. Os4]